ncbi:LytR C-terminal domain-containing protein [Nocardia noduli]|uniref:LytR C-terminal domain-containing protein n=1 Tax=Nocardia noduli TaxID=2815722 RepID=UPI001C244B8C|nr:LytR C-terminal domain-containing protein [Nocardia noduli]
MSYPNPTSGGPPLRALAMVLIALAIVFAGLGAMSLSSSEADDSTVAESTDATGAAPTTTAARVTTTAATAASTTTAETTTATTTTATTTTQATTSAPPPAEALDRAVPVRVLNNSVVAGLASRTASQLQADGWTNVSSGNYANGNIAKTTVYYGDSPGEREAALAIAQQLGAPAEPKSAGVDQGAGVVVILAGN